MAKCNTLYTDENNTQKEIYKKLPYNDKLGIVSEMCFKVLKEGMELTANGLNAAEILRENSFMFDTLPIENMLALIKEF